MADKQVLSYLRRECGWRYRYHLGNGRVAVTYLHVRGRLLQGLNLMFLGQCVSNRRGRNSFGRLTVRAAQRIVLSTTNK